jgi:hypothetical protein
MEKELDRIKVERIKFETKAQAVEAELAVKINFTFSSKFFEISINLLRWLKNHQKRQRKSSKRKLKS